MRRRKLMLGGAALLGAVGGAGGLWALNRRDPKARTPLSAEAYAKAHQPLPAPNGPLSVYHLGHSLVGRDMPKILAQFAAHRFHSQLGWGASLRNHWQGPEAVNGFEVENAHPDFRPAHQAVQSGQYDAVIFTEMVELRDAIKWHASAQYLAEWSLAAQKANPAVRLYLYETWHSLLSPEGWENRIASDLPTLWQGQLLQGAMAWGAPALSLIPGGQVMAAAARAAQAGELPGLQRPQDLFARTPEGTEDPIHPSATGAYLIALTHYATLYHRSPEGLPSRVTLVDGPPLDLPPDLALALQRLCWQVVRTTPHTGIPA